MRLRRHEASPSIVFFSHWKSTKRKRQRGVCSLQVGLGGLSLKCGSQYGLTWLSMARSIRWLWHSVFGHPADSRRPTADRSSDGASFNSAWDDAKNTSTLRCREDTTTDAGNSTQTSDQFGLRSIFKLLSRHPSTHGHHNPTPLPHTHPVTPILLSISFLFFCEYIFVALYFPFSIFTLMEWPVGRNEEQSSLEKNTHTNAEIVDKSLEMAIRLSFKDQVASVNASRDFTLVHKIQYSVALSDVWAHKLFTSQSVTSIEPTRIADNRCENVFHWKKDGL